MNMVKICAVVIYNEGKILMIKRNPMKKSGGKWEIPGGKLEEGESEEEAALREVEEETGLQLDNLELVKEYLGYGNTEIFAYLANSPTKEIKLRENEHSEFGWFTPQEILKLDAWEDNINLVQELANQDY